MDLTREQILEMSEIIAKACGITNLHFREYSYNLRWDDLYQVIEMIGIDCMSANNLEVGEWNVRLAVSPTITGNGLHPDHKMATFLALHEAAKAKLEQEDGN